VRISRWHIVASFFILIGILVWLDQYRLGYEFRISDLVDDRIHHEKITVVAFILAVSILIWNFISHHRRPHAR